MSPARPQHGRPDLEQGQALPGLAQPGQRTSARRGPTVPGQPQPGQVPSGPARSGQSVAGQPVTGQSLTGQEFPGQAQPGAQPGQPSQTQPYPGRPSVQPQPGQSQPGQPPYGEAGNGPAGRGRSPQVRSPQAGRTSGPIGAASVGAPAAGAAAVGAASVGAASVGATSVGVEATGKASVGAASVGAASIPSSTTGRATPGGAPAGPRTPATGDPTSLDRGTGERGIGERGDNGVPGPGDRVAATVRPGAQGVPPRGEEAARASAAVGVPAKGAGSGPSSDVRAQLPGETFTSLRGASSELRKQVRTRRRLRVIMLVSLAVVVLVVLPAIFGLRSLSKDPVFSSLDSLEVPSWAATKVDDQSSGSRWCFLDCTFRERIVQSSREYKETTTAYTSALTAAGWQPWKVAECPEVAVDPANATYSCWRRDEFTLDLWVRLPECAVDQVAALDPATVPSAAATAAPPKCFGSTVSIKVSSAITDTRGKPEPAQSPGLVGETPDAVLSDDPLLEPTPKAS
ncbi:hypothetical protein ACWKSP_03490 [Micromonosporaceae bacterium Da 78-11]